MADRRAWVKLWASWYTTASHLGLGGMALHVGAVLMTCVRWRPGSDDAWAELDDGKPLPVEAIAQRCQETAVVVAKALASLEARGTVRRRDDGAWGFPQFGRWQETIDAARKRVGARKVRGGSAESPETSIGKSAAVPRKVRGKSVGFPREAEAEAEAEAELTHPLPPQAGVTKRRKSSGATATDPRSAQILAAIDRHRAELGMRPLSPSERTDRTIVARLDEGVPAQAMLDALAARRRSAERDPSERQWLNATSPFTGPGKGPGGWAVSMRMLDAEGGRQAQQARGPAIRDYRDALEEDTPP